MGGVKTLIGVLVHDRPELLARSLGALSKLTQGDVRFAIFLDAADEATRGVAKSFRFDASTTYLRSVKNVGAAVATNRILTLREPDEHFIQVASDVEPITPGWNKILARYALTHGLAACSPVWPTGRPDRRDVSRFGTDDPYGTVIPCSGANFITAEWCERIGGWRSYGTYGREDLDYFWRIHYAGGRVSYCPDVVVDNLDADYQGTPEFKRKSQAIEATKWDWARNRDRYAQGLDLHQSIGA